MPLRNDPAQDQVPRKRPAAVESQQKVKEDAVRVGEVVSKQRLEAEQEEAEVDDEEQPLQHILRSNSSNRQAVD
jgi:hypothetical protein